ncbi:MAG: hypothetical protein EPN48_06505 [Microbacteriaceae bacterium]|nr:MAG: hypothetical protein EPN48_06505 [Microbacteriaceae bacterium]
MIGRRTWSVLGVSAFLLVDIALATWAMSTTRATTPETPGPIPTFASVPSSRPTPTETSTPIPLTAQAAPRLFAAVSATEAYRATRGTCTGPAAVLEKTTDAGATWVPLPTTRYNLHTLLALSGATDTHLAAVAGLKANCAVGAYASFTGGQFWQGYPANLADASYIDPRSPDTIHTPTGAEQSPCPTALQLARGFSSTAVLCSGTVAVRVDGAAWTITQVPGVLALTASDSGYTLAVAGAGGCPGIAIESLTAGASDSTLIGCLASLPAPAELTIGQSGNTLWVWSGAATMISNDAGKTW